MIAVCLDDLLEPARLHEFRRVLAQMQHDRGAARGALARLDGELALAVGDPEPGLLGTGLPRGHLDPVRNHESGIEAHAELTYQRAVLALVARELLEELRRAGARDGAEV